MSHHICQYCKEDIDSHTLEELQKCEISLKLRKEVE